MEKRRRQQIIFIVLIPVFIIGLLYLRSQKKQAAVNAVKPKAAEAVSADDRDIAQIPPPEGPLDVTYKGSGKDPLGSLLLAHMNKLASEKMTRDDTKGKTQLPSLSIEGLVWNTDRPQAIVNGDVLKIGDDIKGMEIVDIKKDGIVVMHNGERVFVPKKR